jgi:phosphoribosyl 1,2-cyclic phosphodiesterase
MEGSDTQGVTRELVIHGVRGSTPVGGQETARYGGQTICMSADAGDGRFVIVDLGTGLRALQEELPPRPGGYDFSVFLTHYHWDHLQGLPFFQPLYDAANRFTFYGFPWEGMGVEDLIAGTFRPPWFPVSLAETAAAKIYVALGAEPVRVGDLQISWTRLKHPQGVTAYRIDGPSASVVVATDHESGDPEFDEALYVLGQGSDVLIHDAQYTDGEYELHYEGWGHSTWSHAVEAARATGVERLVLISHDPSHSDDAVDQIVAEARVEFEHLDAARQGMALPL